MIELARGLNAHVEVDAPLGPRTWYGIGGSAALLVHPADTEALVTLVQRCHASQVPVFILGGGANLLVGDAGVEGVVICLDKPGWSDCRIAGDRLVVGGGHDLMKLVLHAANHGLGGSEVLAGIPGTVGGAVRMNAGGAFGQIGPLVERVSLMDVDGRLITRKRADLNFEYRNSNLVEPFVLEVELVLTPQDRTELRERVKEIFRYKESSQPMAERSAGCTFRNPAGSGAGTPAGAWIDRAGLKGSCIGGAEISSRHANFIVTHEGCCATDVLSLMERVRCTVAEKFGVELEREVVVWGT